MKTHPPKDPPRGPTWCENCCVPSRSSSLLPSAAASVSTEHLPVSIGGGGKVKTTTPPRESQWLESVEMGLEDDFPLQRGDFQVPC